MAGHGKETQRRATGKASGIRPHSQAESALRPELMQPLS
jgi:hypothetical protein